MEVKAAEFARMAGVSRVAVGGKIKNGTLILNSGGMLDTDNPVNRAYLEKHRERRRAAALSSGGAAPTAAEARARAAPSVGAADLGLDVGAASAEEMLNMSVGELVRRFGSVNGVEKYAKILRDLSSADEREQRRLERRGELISREFVSRRLFGFLMELTGRLLDIPEGIADELIATVESGGGDVRARLVNIVGDNVSRAIGGAKERVAQELERYRGKVPADDARELVAEQIDELRGDILPD